MKIAVLFTHAQLPVSHDVEVFVAGERGVPRGWGAAVRSVLATTQATVLVVNAGAGEVEALAAPILVDELDVVIGRRPKVPLMGSALNQLAALVLDQRYDVASGSRAFRVTALKAEQLTRDDEGADAEALVKLHAQLYRFGEVPVQQGPGLNGAALRQVGQTFVRYATVRNDADNEHEGYSTLKHLEAGAPNYNAWLARSFAPWAGQRVLEIGAGIGTITDQLAPGRELVTALEVDAFYVRRLANRFRGRANVEPLQADVSLADWQALAARRFDTIVLSNVLEHIADDSAAVQTFAKILAPGGRVIIFVPALPQLFGSIDQAVGHHRRYVPDSLRSVLEQNGFEVERLKYMNLLGIPGWYVNGRVFKRRVLPPVQLRVYDALAPHLAQLEARLPIPVGMSLLAVARRI